MYDVVKALCDGVCMGVYGCVCVSMQAVECMVVPAYYV